MAHDLASTQTELEFHLSDLTNLIWSTAALEEAIRSALRDLSRVYGEPQTLAGLDGETDTTYDDLDQIVIVTGALAYSLIFRVTGRFEEATPEPNLAAQLADWAVTKTADFQAQLASVQLRLFQKSKDSPFSQWEWKEGASF